MENAPKLTPEECSRINAEAQKLVVGLYKEYIDFFFESPNNWIPSRTEFSNLYLLRRDIFSCLGCDPTTGEVIKYSVLWPGAMSILAGIDLLAKFYYGNDDYGQVSNRFKGYIKKYFRLDDTECEIIYQLRNSLLHSFGLYSYKKAKGSNERIEYKFGLTASESNLITKHSENFYRIDVITLWRKFETSIINYYDELAINMDLKNKFIMVFPNYSKTIIGDSTKLIS